MKSSPATQNDLRVHLRRDIWLALSYLWGVCLRVEEKSQNCSPGEILLTHSQLFALGPSLSCMVSLLFIKIAWIGPLQKGQYHSLLYPKKPIHLWTLLQSSFSHCAVSVILKYSPMNPSCVGQQGFYLAIRHVKMLSGTALISPSDPVWWLRTKGTKLNSLPSSHDRVVSPILSRSPSWIFFLLQYLPWMVSPKLNTIL